MPNQKFSDVSVIIPAYRAANYIDRSIGSVLNQTICPKEVIIVDDGSDDNTSQKIEKYTNNDTSITINKLYQNNQGAGAARNLAIEAATGRYVAFLDSDDEWLPGKLERSLFHIERGNFALVAHNVLMVDGKSQKENDIALRFKKSYDSLFHGLYRRGFIATSTVLAPLSAIKKVGGFDSTLPVAQDFELWLRLLGSDSGQFLVFDEYLTKYYVREESITRRTDSRLSCTIEIARRHSLNLRKYEGSPSASLWFRLIAIHYEAIRAHYFSKKYFSALRVLFKLPAVMILETIRFAKASR